MIEEEKKNQKLAFWRLQRRNIEHSKLSMSILSREESEQKGVIGLAMDFIKACCVVTGGGQDSICILSSHSGLCFIINFDDQRFVPFHNAGPLDEVFGDFRNCVGCCRTLTGRMSRYRPRYCR